MRPETTATLWHLRRKIGWLSPELHLHHPSDRSCLDVVCSGFFNQIGLYEPCISRQRATARDCLRRLGLSDQAKQAFGKLSLGDQRLVPPAGAVAKKPKLLILDETCQGLDIAHRRSLLATVDRLIVQTRASLIFVTHHSREMPACQGLNFLPALKCAGLSRFPRDYFFPIWLSLAYSSTVPGTN